MQLGSIEYFLTDEKHPSFFDFNPVSSIHPLASDLIGEDPNKLIADWVFTILASR
jgi:hypothetical protein